jgi:uncharacterized damage-inducible protein DinB
MQAEPETGADFGMKAHFAMMAGYNGWANERLYGAAAALPAESFAADHGAFFASLRGTLNHLLVTDRIWMRRITGEGPTYGRLDAIIADDLATLAAERRLEDARIGAFIDGLDGNALAAPVTYSPLTASGSFTQPLAAILAHLFNHQAHHRGQATVILTRIGGRDAAPSLDLPVFQRSTGVGMA